MMVIHSGDKSGALAYLRHFRPDNANDAIQFIFAMGFLYYFGRGVEEYVGRNTYIKLYVGPRADPGGAFHRLLGLLGIWGSYMGGYGTIFGLIYCLRHSLPRRGDQHLVRQSHRQAWWAYCPALCLASFISARRLASRRTLVRRGSIGYFGMRLIGAGYGMTWMTDWIEEKQAQRLANKHQIKVLKDAEETASIDDILEKISKQGVGSLSAKERAALEQARTNLLKRDQR